MVRKQMLNKDSEEKRRGPQYLCQSRPLFLIDGPMRKTGFKMEPNPQSIM
jgi:hypothetical protein